MKIASAWIEVENGIGAMRIKKGGDPDNIDDRVAFIEKTPRVRIREAFLLSHMPEIMDFLNWCERDFKGDGPNDPESRAWCDTMLLALGYTLE